MNSIKRFMLGVLALLTFVDSAHADPIITGSKPYTFTPGTVIASSQVNADFDYIINQVNANAAKNGVNSSITALLGMTTPLDPSSGGSPIWNGTTVGGTADAITITATRPAISSFSYTAGNILTFVATGVNTVTGPTVNVNSLGAKTLQKASYSGTAINLRPGEIQTGAVITAYYDGTNFQVINIPDKLGTVSTIASAATTDLGTAPSHMINVTGTTTITSFGSTCNVGDPYFYIRFSSALSITYNATSMITPGAVSVGISANDVVEALCLGSGNWRILTHASETFFGPIATVASAATTDIGAATSHNINVTGTTGITSFGSSCQLDKPYYIIRFSSSLAITRNATTLETPTGTDLSIGANDVLIATCTTASNWRILTQTRIPLTPFTEQATTSGTSINFTAIPADARRITVVFNGVSLNGTDNLLVQIGDSGGLETSGYVSNSAFVDAGTPTIVTSTSGFVIRGATASILVSGSMTLRRIGTGNIWVEDHCGQNQTSATAFGGGTKTLSATLDRLSLVTTGSNTFDAGSANIFIE